MSFKVNVYDPKSQAYAARIKHEEWERHRAFISDLHAAKTPRKVMLKRLRDEYNFRPTLGQLQAKCKEWNLKVYAKEGMTAKSPLDSGNHIPVAATRHRHNSPSDPAFHLVTETGYIHEWSDDYRIHPAIPSSHGDTTLPATGLLANTADSHWPLPEDAGACEAMLRAAHYYLAVNAFQQAFSIYRAVYLFQRREMSICNPKLIRTVLLSACSAVTEHQRNIVHSVLCEIGSSTELDAVDALYIDCLQSASLSMMSADSCDIENGEQVRARATAYLHILNASNITGCPPTPVGDTQAMLYQFEHALLMQEHESKILQHLLNWCESVVDKLHREIDDIFVGQSSCEEEYHYRVGQVLSGYLVSQWHRRKEDQEDQHRHLMEPSGLISPLAFHFLLTTTQTLVALAFMIVDAVRCDPLCARFGRLDDGVTRMWFLDAAKLFKRGIRMLSRLDERSRCAVFSETYLERFYASISYRQKAWHWSAQLPAVVDSVGMWLAQQNTEVAAFADMAAPMVPLSEEPLLEMSMEIDTPNTTAPPVADTDLNLPQPVGNLPTMAVSAPSPISDCNSIASFLNTYHRTLKTKLEVRTKSGKSTPGDVMSLTSSADFKFGVVSNQVSTSDVDSFWLMVAASEA